MTGISLSLKNLWGCIPDTMRVTQHQNLSYKLALINKLLKPQIVIIDGIYALDNHGPMFGNVLKPDILIVSNNAVAADMIGTNIMGFSHQQIPHIVTSAKYNNDPLDLSNIVLNQDWTIYKRRFRVRKTIIDILLNIPFNNKYLAKLIFDSPFTSVIRKIINIVRSTDEKIVVNDIYDRR